MIVRTSRRLLLSRIIAVNDVVIHYIIFMVIVEDVVIHYRLHRGHQPCQRVVRPYQDMTLCGQFCVIVELS